MLGIELIHVIERVKIVFTMSSLDINDNMENAYIGKIKIGNYAQMDTTEINTMLLLGYQTHYRVRSILVREEGKFGFIFTELRQLVPHFSRICQFRPWKATQEYALVDGKSLKTCLKSNHV